MSKPRKRIGPYRILDELGAGGMGVVYRATHEVLCRDVAVKELICRKAEEKEAVQRFRREGMALAQLKHESIVGIHDLFVSAEKLYMVLEYVDGPSLATVLENGPLPWDVTAILGMRVAAALEHAHHHHVIHRDIKPANIMVARSGEVKLMDFGIARDQLQDKLTRTGYAVGTPAYMPPETLTGNKADAVSDLYSLGVSLYECVAGKHPFADADSKKTFAAILAGRFTPLRRAKRGLPWKFRRIIERCLQVDPKSRFRSAADLRLALELLLASYGARANPRVRVVGFLKSRSLVSEDQALTCMNPSELRETSQRDLKKPGRAWRWVAAAALLAMAGGVVWLSQRPGLVAGLLP